MEVMFAFASSRPDAPRPCDPDGSRRWPGFQIKTTWTETVAHPRPDWRARRPYVSGGHMRYQISGKQIDIGEALQTHVKDSLGAPSRNTPSARPTRR
jgi:hypothetical protein